MTEEELIAAYLSKAREQYCSDDIEIDDARPPKTSQAEDGCWVAGWLWVYRSDVDPRLEEEAYAKG